MGKNDVEKNGFDRRLEARGRGEREFESAGGERRDRDDNNLN